MADDGRKLSSKQHKAVVALVVHSSIEAASKAAGVSERSIYRWQHCPTFRGALRTTSRMLQIAIVNKLRASKVSILNSLEGLINDSSVPAKERGKVGIQALKILTEDKSISWEGEVEPVSQVLADQEKEDAHTLKEVDLEARDNELWERDEAYDKGFEDLEKQREELRKWKDAFDEKVKKLEEEKKEFERQKKEWEEEDEEEE
tara:strand:- start:68 stop:676 length:609 start_codon:yes stop_codon:yes gene_type:complete